VRGATLFLVLLTACGAAEGPAERRSRLSELLPSEHELIGWSAAEGPTVLTPDTLYEYLNGGAERYLGLGFEELLHVRYQRGDEPLAGVTLDIYDMGTALGAFGIYSAARTPGVDIRPWGAEGYRTGPVAAAWKGRVYIHGEVDDELPELIETLERLMSEAADRAAGEPSMPALLSHLPLDGRVAQSERYVAADLLGHAFLPGGVMATYELDGRRAELFFSDLGDQAAAVEALEALRSHLSSSGTVPTTGAPAVGSDGFRYVDPTLGEGTAVRAGRMVAAIHGEIGPVAREAILAELVRLLDD
jgi:PAS domain-containing protein